MNNFGINLQEKLIVRKYYIYLLLCVIGWLNPLAISAQVDTSGVTSYTAQLTGTQQVPSIMTTAYGNVIATVEDSLLIVSGSFNNLQGDLATDLAGGAHIHSGLAGENGGIEFLLTPQVSSDMRSGAFLASENTFTLNNEQINLLLERGLYVNVHSLAHLPGELRGQLLPAAEEQYHAILMGSNQTPAVQSNAYGSLMLELNDNILTVSGSFAGLSSTIAVALAGGAHIHEGANGQDGALVFPLNLEVNADSTSASIQAAANIFELTTAQLETLQANAYYINVHSLNNMPGEIRGQITPISTTLLRAELNGVSQTTPIKTTANGKLYLSYNGDSTLTVSGSFNNLSSALNTELAGGIHLHFGIAGTNGGIAIILNPTVSADNLSGVLYPEDNQFTIDSVTRAALLNRGLYVNVHSLENVPGELRGQILPLAKNYIAANLSGLNQLESVITPSFGNVIAEVYDSRIVLSGSFSDLTDAIATDLAGGAHLHIAPTDGEGGIGFILNSTIDTDFFGGDFNTSENTFEITEGQRDSLLSSEYYINIHSLSNLPGELRGQLLREGNHFPSSSFEVLNPPNDASIVIDPIVETDIDISWESTIDPDEDTVVYTWQLSDSMDFSSPLLSLNVGVDLGFVVTSTDLDGILTDLGIQLSDTPTTFYHRVLAGDGSVQSSSEVLTIQISKEAITSTTEITREIADLILYPNPTVDQVSLNMEGFFEEEVNIRVYNSIGVLIEKYSADTANDQVLVISTSNWIPGVYLVVLETNKATITKSLMKVGRN